MVGMYTGAATMENGACRFVKKLKIEQPDDPASPLLDTYLEKSITRKDPYIPMVTEALFHEDMEAISTVHGQMNG